MLRRITVSPCRPGPWPGSGTCSTTSSHTTHDAAGAPEDKLAVDVFNRAGRFVGFAVANLVSLLDPEVVILGGGMVADPYLGPLQAAMLERAQSLAAKKVRAVVSKMAETVNLLGSARLAGEPAAST